MTFNGSKNSGFVKSTSESDTLRMGNTSKQQDITENTFIPHKSIYCGNCPLDMFLGFFIWSSTISSTPVL